MSTAAVTRTNIGALDILREQVRAIHASLHVNIDDLTPEEAFIQPQPGGNCLNWIVGHLACVNDQMLPLVGQKPVTGAENLKQYSRGSAPLRDPALALPLSELVAIWDEQVSRLAAGLSALSAEALSAPAPFSPRKDPNETVGSLLAIVIFHQSYHVGQTGLLRRTIGKAGAIR